MDSQMLAGCELYAKILAALGHGAMAAHRTLNPLILVRLQVPRLKYCGYRLRRFTPICLQDETEVPSCVSVC